jgi:hypothetical protein
MDIESRVNALETQMSQLEALQEQNTRDLGDLIASTQGLVDLHKDIQATVRIGGSVQRFVVWCGKWSILAAVCTAAASYIDKHF